jgi:hypothetical protein
MSGTLDHAYHFVHVSGGKIEITHERAVAQRPTGFRQQALEEPPVVKGQQAYGEGTRVAAFVRRHTSSLFEVE